MVPKAVLFDMDGTIIDSVPAWHRTFNQVLKQTGSKPVSYKRFCTDILGQSSEEDVRRFFPSLSAKELTALYGEFFPENIQSVKLFPDTLRVLNYLSKKKILKGIVTNTPRELMLLTLNTVRIKDRFDVILGGTDVSVGKPGPEIIHRACELLKVSESETVMVGDTSSDIKCGRNAGCYTIGVGVEGDSRIENLGELTSLLEKIEKA